MWLFWYASAFVVLLSFSAFFSASETTLFSLSKIQLRRIQERHAHRGKILLDLLNQPTRTLNTILIGNTLVNITASALMAHIFLVFFGRAGISFSVMVTTCILLVFGEVTPKICAIHWAEHIVSWILFPIRFISIILYPLHWICNVVSGAFIRFFTHRKGASQGYITEDELATLVSMGEEEGIIDKDEEKMLTAVFELGKRCVYEIMTPHVDIVAVEESVTGEELIHIMKESKHSKIPVYRKTKDDFIGIIYSKDCFLFPEEKWQRFIQPLLVIPETKYIYDLLTEFRARKSEVAITVDEFGGTSGLVTLEDILEEIVGEIRGEFDKEEDFIKKIGNRIFVFKGDTLLKKVEEVTEILFETEEVETLGGFVMHYLGRIPRSGEAFEYKGHHFVVNSVVKNRVRYLTIKKMARFQEG